MWGLIWEAIEAGKLANQVVRLGKREYDWRRIEVNRSASGGGGCRGGGDENRLPLFLLLRSRYLYVSYFIVKKF